MLEQHRQLVLFHRNGELIEQIGRGHRGELRGHQFQRERQTGTSLTQRQHERNDGLVQRQGAAGLLDPADQQLHLHVVARVDAWIDRR